MFPQRFAHQRGTIQFRPARGPIGGLQEFLIENYLDCFHMSILLHPILHMPISGSVKITERLIQAAPLQSQHFP
jgi:hypothetical protein